MGRSIEWVFRVVDTVFALSEQHGISIDAAVERYLRPGIERARQAGDLDTAADRERAMAMVAAIANSLHTWCKAAPPPVTP